MAWQEFRDCPVCGEEMLTWRETQVTCSKKCQGALERSRRNYPVEDWANLYKEGLTYKQIAKQYGTSYAVVRRSVQHAGVPPRSSHEHLRKYDGNPQRS